MYYIRRVPPPDKKIEALLRELPDPEGARLFYERAAAEDARVAKLFARDEGLLADALALAAWSPLLGATLAQNPDYLANDIIQKYPAEVELMSPAAAGGFNLGYESAEHPSNQRDQGVWSHRLLDELRTPRRGGPLRVRRHH